MCVSSSVFPPQSPVIFFFLLISLSLPPCFFLYSYSFIPIIFWSLYISLHFLSSFIPFFSYLPLFPSCFFRPLLVFLHNPVFFTLLPMQPLYFFFFLYISSFLVLLFLLSPFPFPLTHLSIISFFHDVTFISLLLFLLFPCLFPLVHSFPHSPPLLLPRPPFIPLCLSCPPPPPLPPLSHCRPPSPKRS